MKPFSASSENSFQSMDRYYDNQISSYLFQFQIIISYKDKEMFEYQEVIDRSMSLRECWYRHKSATHSLLKCVKSVNGICR